ncbi:MAG: hypothetical protein ACRELD_16290 [Longimicrobiales bacterium]
MAEAEHRNGGNGGIYAILIIIVILLVGAILWFSGALGERGDTERIEADVNIEVPAGDEGNP